MTETENKVIQPKERALASIRLIDEIQPIYVTTDPLVEATSIDAVIVGGWLMVSNKENGFKAGDKVIFFEVDSLLPEADWSNFLPSKVVVGDETYYRVKTRKFGKMAIKDEHYFKPVIAQGLIAPLSILPEIEGEYKVGQDVTATLGVKKHEPVETFKSADIAGAFTHLVPKTDEKRVQSFMDVLNEMKGFPYFITLKLDGTSCTLMTDEEGIVHVYSRNNEMNELSSYYKTAAKSGIVDAMKANPLYAVQGEIVGNGVQANPLKLTGLKFFAFNVYNVKQSVYLSYPEFIKFCEKNNIPTVPVLEVGESFSKTLPELEQMAKGFYEGTTNHREGIVIRPQTEQYSVVLEGRMSFKFINVDYLLHEK